MKMKRIVPVVLCLAVIVAAVFAYGKENKEKSGPLTGTWECMSHGGSQGDMPFTLYLEQTKDTLTGSVSSPMGGTDISAGTLKKNAVEIHIDTPQGNYLLNGQFKKGEISGKWSSDTENGTWEGRKKASPDK